MDASLSGEHVEAALNNDCARVGASINAGDNVYSADANFWTLMECAANEGCSSCTKRLLEYDVGINKRMTDGKTAASIAASRGHLVILKFLFDNGADVMIADECGLLPLHWACKMGRPQAARYLLQSCPRSVNAKTLKGELQRTPLHMAAMENHIECVKALVQSGADIEVGDIHNVTALHLAAYNGHQWVTNYLLDNGADVTTTAFNDERLLQTARRRRLEESRWWKRREYDNVIRVLSLAEDELNRREQLLRVEARSESIDGSRVMSSKNSLGTGFSGTVYRGLWRLLSTQASWKYILFIFVTTLGLVYRDAGGAENTALERGTPRLWHGARVVEARARRLSEATTCASHSFAKGLPCEDNRCLQDISATMAAMSLETRTGRSCSSTCPVATCTV